jgi:hypothetical protein
MRNLVLYLDKGYRADRKVWLICENNVKTNNTKADSLRWEPDCVRTVPNTGGKFYAEDISSILAAPAAAAVVVAAAVVAEAATVAATNVAGTVRNVALHPSTCKLITGPNVAGFMTGVTSCRWAEHEVGPRYVGRNEWPVGSIRCSRYQVRHRGSRTRLGDTTGQETRDTSVLFALLLTKETMTCTWLWYCICPPIFIT